MQPYRSIWFTILVVEVSTIVLTSAGVCKAPSHTAVLGKRAPDDKHPELLSVHCRPPLVTDNIVQHRTVN
ncbi:uncharacterized protein isoform X2 [Rhodnius prolixus]|uniref:uncharacterized protein isoform X2 n=1 Tax=Rhodnius prolixus TaxID=13249 RepID=UPI003D18BD4C